MHFFKYLILSTFLLTSFSCNEKKPKASQLTNVTELEGQFQSIIDSVLNANPGAVGILTHVEAPDKKISWTGAVGLSMKVGPEKLQKETPVLIASNTKTFVAATILRLVEMGNLSLGQSMHSIISSDLNTAFINAGYDTKAITLKHLLSHTSGLKDYVDKDYFAKVDSLPEYEWQMDEQLLLASTKGSPLDDPGKVYQYADVNFVLLAKAIEKARGKVFYEAIRTTLGFDALGLNNTWWAKLEEKPKDALALPHQYDDKRDWDSYQFDPSWDLYGGGGLISTTRDAATFFQALFTGKIIKDKNLLKEMTTEVLPREESIYCLGLMKLNFDGQPAYYHGGFWGTNVMYLPEMNMTISSFTLERGHRAINADLTKEIIKLIP